MTLSSSSGFPLRLASLVLVSGMTVGSASLLAAQTAGQDLNHAGTETKNAAKDTGHGVAKGTTKAYHATKHGTVTAADKTKEGTTKGYDKTKEGTTKAYDKTKEGTKHVLGANGQHSTATKDQVKESNQKAHDSAKESTQELKDSSPK